MMSATMTGLRESRTGEPERRCAREKQKMFHVDGDPISQAMNDS
jgi:hypothetical protein